MKFLVPEKIETKRLNLRQFINEDWKEIHGYYSDKEATKFTFGHTLSEAESWRAMAGMIGHWQLRGYGPYAMEDKVSQKIIGIAGFWYPNDWPELEIKWALIRQYWGNGYASEAARAIQAAAIKHMPGISLISFIHSDNISSIKLALSINAIFEKQVEFRGGNWHIYRHPNKGKLNALR